MNYQTGNLKLLRKESVHTAAYCVLKSELAALLNVSDYLSFSEMEYFNSLSVDKRRLSFLGGRYAAKKTVASLTDERILSLINIERGVFDYPVVQYPFKKKIQVSLSHTDDIVVALSFAEIHPLSVDVEVIDDTKMEALNSVINEKEFHALRIEGTSDIEKLTVFWTIKESLSKMLRTGMMTEFSLFEISGASWQNDDLICLFRNFPQYKAVSRIVGKYAITVVLPKLSFVNFTDLFCSFEEVAFNKSN